MGIALLFWERVSERLSWMVICECILRGYGYGYILGPSPVPPIYLTGSFGLVRPAWI